ncbi:MAG: phosphoribulokinase [Woeseiaceae bacterium]
MSNKQDGQILELCAQHQLPATFQTDVVDHYLPLARALITYKPGNRPLVLGINGAQGTGKSTLAEFLKIAAEYLHNWSVAVLSIDDFYLTQAERETLARQVHPLLATRGVPGTHDLAMLVECLDALVNLAPGQEILLPRFDKSADERAARSSWPQVEGPVDLIIFEGWCVGTTAQSESELLEPVNELELTEDDDGEWRRYVNRQLQKNYSKVFQKIDKLVFLEAPGFDAIFRWRMQQEEQLEVQMSEDALLRFIQHYERITRANLNQIPNKADFVIKLGVSHNVEDIQSSALDF